MEKLQKIILAFGLGLFFFALPTAKPAHAAFCEKFYNEFVAKKGRKAMAYSTSENHCYWRWNGKTQSSVNRNVIKDCGKKGAKDCRLVDVSTNLAARIKRVQTALKKMNFYTSDIDGKVGSGTRAAVRKFQGVIGEKQNGTISFDLSKTIEAVGAKAGSFSSLCRSGSKKTTQGNRSWLTDGDGKAIAKFAQFSGLSTFDCVRLLGENKPKVTEPKRTVKTETKDKVRLASNYHVCLQATRRPFGGSRVVDRSKSVAAFVTELNRRNLTAAGCGRILNDSEPKIATTKDPELQKYSDHYVCSRGTRKFNNQQRTYTVNQARLIYREELKRRGLDLGDCAHLMGDGISVAKVPKAVTEPKVETTKPTTTPKTPTKEQTLAAAIAAYQKGQFTQALIGFAPLAAQENSTAQLYLGHMYSLGQGIPANKTFALNWYEKAKNNGDPIAQIMISSLKTDAGGTKKTPKVAVVKPKTTEKPVVVPQKVTPQEPVQKRLALVLGNGDYENSTKLPNPENDARAVAKMLKDLGFEVLAGYDLDRNGMESIIRKFARRASEVDLTLFFYAGHGMQVGRRNFLVPIDAKLQEATAVDFELLDVQQTVVKYMGGGSKLGIVLLDACRDNPLSRSFARTFSRTRSGTVSVGLAEMQNHGGLLFGFATAPGDVAADGEGKHSPFTEGLLKHLAVPGLEIQQVMTRVKREVAYTTGNKQRPWHNSDLTVDVYLAKK